MSRGYSQNCGRLTLTVNAEGARQHDYGHGVQLSCVAGWNGSCPTVSHTLSVEELHDLRHLIDRALVAAGSTA